MKFRLWLVWRYLQGIKGFLSLHILLAILAMSLGVGSLILAMAIVSGYETTLRRVLIDSLGHVVFVRRGEPIANIDEIQKQVMQESAEIVASTPFLLIEAIATKSGQVQGVLIEGIDSQAHEKVVDLRKHLADGAFALGPAIAEGAPVLLGKVLADRLALKVGDALRFVVPVTDKLYGDRFRPKVFKGLVVGVLDLGHHDFDSRYVLTDLKELQKFSKVEGGATGLRLRLKNHQMAGPVATTLSQKFGLDYSTLTWYDSNKNLFDAIDYEKPIIFLIVFLIVVAAGFSVAGALYVSVLRRFRDVSVLKAMGASPTLVRKFFTAQGLFVGFVGSVVGLGFGLLVCYLFIEVQRVYPLFSGEVYRIGRIDLEIRPKDLLSIFAAALAVSYFASFAPARRGARLSVVEGLRYE